MIYISLDTSTYIPKTCLETGEEIKLINLVDKREYLTSVTLNDDGVYECKLFDIGLTTGQYKYVIEDFESGLALYGDFKNEKSSYNEKITYKQYKRL